MYSIATTYEIRFTPINPIPADGSIQITWPNNVFIREDVQCKVITNRVWEQSCSPNTEKRTINIERVFSEMPSFSSEVTITLIGVINPENNKEKGSSFKITTYADSSQIFLID